MFTTNFELAALNIVCIEDNLQLTLTPTLTLLTSDPALHALTPQQLCKELRTAKRIVKRGPASRLDVEVACDGALTHAVSMESLKDKLGLAICTAPWWSQLPICPVLRQLPHFLLNETCPFSVAITDALPNFLSEDDHNASRGTQDVKVPSGIPVVQVNCIALALRFRSLVENTNHEQIDVSGDILDSSFEGILHDHEALQDDCLLLDDHDHLGSSDVVEDRERDSTGDNMIVNDFEYEDSFLLEENSFITTSSFTADLPPFDSQESVLTHLTSPDDRVEASLGPRTAINEKTARLLTDVAIRTIVGGGQTTPADGVKLLRPLPRYTWAALMPLLFSPNFSETISQRSRFLPTITNTITSLAVMAQSPSLKVKLARLTSEGSLYTRPSLAGSVQSHIFRTMHTSLFSARSARNLRVTREEEMMPEDRDEDIMIIDGSAISLEKNGEKGLTESIFEMDFEDMLEDEPLSEDEVDMLLDLEITRQGLFPRRGMDKGDEIYIQDADTNVMMDLDLKDEIMKHEGASEMEMFGNEDENGASGSPGAQLTWM